MTFSLLNPSRARNSRHEHARLLIVGGGLGGVSAALAALRGGLDVVLTEEHDWLGGQLTSQGVPLDEGPWAETAIGSRSFRQLRRRIRDFYYRNYPLTAAARARHPFNPGMGNIGTLCHEPRVAVQVIAEMLLPYVTSGRLRLHMRHRAVAVDQQGDWIREISFLDLETGHERTITADLVIDATETGELLALSPIEHVCGAESQAETGELHAVVGEADPLDQQALTWCMALDYHPGEDHTINEPDGYQSFRTLQLDCWPGPQYAWTVSDHVTHQPLERPLFAGDTDAEYLFDLWHARRIAWRRNFENGFYASDITIANWPQMDYWLKPAVGVSAEAAREALAEARNFSLGFLYWMQTGAPRHDGGIGYRGLRPRGDVLGTTDGLAKQAYYREGLRIKAEYTIREQDIGVAARNGLSKAESYADSVGIGAYRIDLHPSTTRTRNTVDIDCYPFQIPLGALLPVRIENYLPACKNLGTTRITNGAYRVHPVEWSIGEASGALAAFASRKGVPPRAVRQRPALLSEFQADLTRAGVHLEWPGFGALTPRSRTGYRPPAAAARTA